MWTTKDITDQTGKTVIVTGANTGIGYETAKALYEAGAHVILACRDEAKAQQALNSIASPHASGSLEVRLLDLSDLDAIQTFAADFSSFYSSLDILINNAGVMIPPASKTAQGYELQFGVNFLGHFALTAHLYPILNKTLHARIVTVSSMAYLNGTIDFDNLKSEKNYDPTREYGQSKLANLLFSIELQRRIEQAGHQVLSIAAQPGANKTDLIRYMTSEAYEAALKRFGNLMEPWQGALPSLYAAVSEDAIGGALYGPDGEGGYKGYPSKAIIQPHALDEHVARMLWDTATRITGLSFP